MQGTQLFLSYNSLVLLEEFGGPGKIWCVCVCLCACVCVCVFMCTTSKFVHSNSSAQQNWVLTHCVISGCMLCVYTDQLVGAVRDPCVHTTHCVISGCMLHVSTDWLGTHCVISDCMLCVCAQIGQGPIV